MPYLCHDVLAEPPIGCADVQGKAAKKKYDKVRLSYETSVTALRAVTKKQKVNLNKVLEAELCKDTYEEAFRAVSEETTGILSATVEKHNLVMIDALCHYTDAYSSFFANACVSLQDMKASVQRSKEIVLEVRLLSTLSSESYCGPENEEDGGGSSSPGSKQAEVIAEEGQCQSFSPFGRELWVS